MAEPKLKNKPNFKNIAEKLKDTPGAEELIKNCVLLNLNYDPNFSFGDQLNQVFEYVKTEGNLRHLLYMVMGMMSRAQIDSSLGTAELIIKLIFHSE